VTGWNKICNLLVNVDNCEVGCLKLVCSEIMIGFEGIGCIRFHVVAL